MFTEIRRPFRDSARMTVASGRREVGGGHVTIPTYPNSLACKGQVRATTLTSDRGPRVPRRGFLPMLANTLAHIPPPSIVRKKSCGVTDPYSKPLDAREMPDVVGDDGVRPPPLRLGREGIRRWGQGGPAAAGSEHRSRGRRNRRRGRGFQPSPRESRTHPRLDRRAATTTFVSRTTEYMGSGALLTSPSPCRPQSPQMSPRSWPHVL